MKSPAHDGADTSRVRPHSSSTQNSRKIRLMQQPLIRRYRSSLARLTVTACACVLTAASIGAVGRNPLALDQAKPAPSQQSGLPPLIDRELFFGNPEIASARFPPTANTSRSGSPGTTR